MSTGQTGRTPGGVPPKFFMFIGFVFPQFRSILLAQFPTESSKYNSLWDSLGLLEGSSGPFRLAFLSKTLSDPPTQRLRKPPNSGFREVHFLEILENLEILEFLENPKTVEKKGESFHFLEILEKLEILEILDITPAKRPLS